MTESTTVREGIANQRFQQRISAACCAASVVVGAMGEIMDYRLCLTVCAAFACACCWCTIWRQRKAVRRFYNAETEEERAVQG
ncbi:MAG: hypothetical protein RSE58_10075 [Clostridia bacterium]